MSELDKEQARSTYELFCDPYVMPSKPKEYYLVNVLVVVQQPLDTK